MPAEEVFPHDTFPVDDFNVNVAPLQRVSVIVSHVFTVLTSSLQYVKMSQVCLDANMVWHPWGA